MLAVRILSLVAIALAVLKAESAASPPCGPRVRRPYSKLTATEKETLQLAFEAAMLQGHHHRFVTVHQYSLNEYEAHSCMFLYWHRRFLWGYENMLRSLGERFKCLTIPYWDYAGMSSNQLDPNVTCDSLATCNPVLVDFGASSISNPSSYVIGGTPGTANGGETISADNCVHDPTNPVTRSFCESEAAFQSKRCLRCIPRGNWHNAQIAADTTLASMSNQIFASSFAELTKNFMYKVHPKIHANLDGAMGTMSSPSDPVFFLHHATIDALLSIYTKCQAPYASGTDPKVFPPSDWNLFNNRVCGPYVFRPKSSSPRFSLSRNSMSMLYYNGTTDVASVDVGDPESPLAQYFSSTSKNYMAYYRYPQSSTISYDFTDTGFDVINSNCEAWIGGSYNSTESSAALMKDIKKTTSKQKKHRDGPPLPVVKQIDFTQNVYKHTKRYIKDDKKAREYVEMMLCVHRNECMGGVFDYSAEFKKSFKWSLSPYCYNVLDDIAQGRKHIPVPGWAKLIMETYGCRNMS
ncbi:unnamed protein product [Aphanomyces euteiches]